MVTVIPMVRGVGQLISGQHDSRFLRTDAGHCVDGGQQQGFVGFS